MFEDETLAYSLLKEQVFVPTRARTKAGFYMGMEPVEVVDAQDRAALSKL
jgi:hypothetical protein